MVENPIQDRIKNLEKSYKSFTLLAQFFVISRSHRLSSLISVSNLLFFSLVCVLPDHYLHLQTMVYAQLRRIRGDLDIGKDKAWVAKGVAKRSGELLAAAI